MSKHKLDDDTLTVQSRTENLSRIREFVQTAAAGIGFDKDDIENMILAVDEACTNIIKHAYKSHPDGDIVVNLKFNRGLFTIEILDYGKSFEPDSIPEPDLQKYYRQHKVGGLGMFLMKKLMDDVKYVSIPGKYNRVLLSKHLQQNAG